MNAAENNHVRACPRRLLRKAQRITDIIRDILDLGYLIVMGENDGVELFFEGEDFAREGVKLSARHRFAQGKPIHAWGLHFWHSGHAPNVNATVKPRQFKGSLAGWSE